MLGAVVTAPGVTVVAVAPSELSAATAAGYGAVVLDSLSHFWTGEGGLLEIVDGIARTKYRNDTHRAWADANTIQQALVDAVLRSKLHVIAAMRTKKDYVRETYTDKDGREKTRIRPAGTKTVQRDEFDYEFDIVGRFDVPMMMAVLKSRCAALPPETVIEKPGADFVATLTAWLGSGESFEEQEKAATAAEEQAARELAELELALLALADEYRELQPEWDELEKLKKAIAKNEGDRGWLERATETYTNNVEKARADREAAEKFPIPEKAKAAAA